MKRRWRKVRYRIEWFGLFLLARLVPRLPRRVVVWLANVSGWVAYYCDRRGRAVALANLAAAFGAEYSPAQRQRIARASFCNFARTMCDLFWAKAVTPENYRRYLRIENAEVLHRVRERDAGIVIVCIHHGNFEWAGLATGFEGLPAMVVTESFKNASVSRFFQSCRETAGHRIIPQEASMLRLLKHVRRGGVAGMLADLNLRPSEAATVIDTFGMKMCVTILHSVLAQRGRAELIPVEGLSLPDGTCRVKFHPPLPIPAAASVQQIAQRCWDFFEPTIRKHPEHWLWAYKHWRFKPATAASQYPFYAQPCAEFDRLLEKCRADATISRAA
jgi:lauroyl/myristoyl acyltransferase